MAVQAMTEQITDIVERLRGPMPLNYADAVAVRKEAADEIERLRAQLVSDIRAETEIDRLETEIERLRGLLADAAEEKDARPERGPGMDVTSIG